MVPHSPHALDRIPTSREFQKSYMDDDSAMTESDSCIHGWNTDHNYLNPEWITIPEVAAVLKITCQRWMGKTCSVFFCFLNHVLTIMYCSVQVLMYYVLDGSCSGLDLFVTN